SGDGDAIVSGDGHAVGRGRGRASFSLRVDGILQASAGLAECVGASSTADYATGILPVDGEQSNGVGDDRGCCVRSFRRSGVGPSGVVIGVVGSASASGNGERTIGVVVSLNVDRV